MSSPRYAPAGLLLACGGHRVASDGGPGAEPTGPLDAWLVTDDHSELRAQLRHLAASRGPRARDRPVAERVAAEAQRRRVRRLVFAHIERPTIRAIDGDARPPFGELDRDGQRYRL